MKQKKDECEHQVRLCHTQRNRGEIWFSEQL